MRVLLSFPFRIMHVVPNLFLVHCMLVLFVVFRLPNYNFEFIGKWLWLLCVFDFHMECYISRCWHHLVSKLLCIIGRRHEPFGFRTCFCSSTWESHAWWMWSATGFSSSYAGEICFQNIKWTETIIFTTFQAIILSNRCFFRTHFVRNNFHFKKS